MSRLIRARLRARVLASVLALASLASAAPAPAQARGAVVRGVVRDEIGEAIAGAQISIAGSEARTTSDLDGAFLLRAPAGSVRIVARRLGFRPAETAIALSADTEVVQDIVLVGASIRLAPVVVHERREVFDARLAGFNERRTRKVGYFITRERLEATHAFGLTDVLRETPGVRVSSTRGAQHSLRLRGASCPPLVFVDGFAATAGEFDLDIIDPRTVEGIEIYSGMLTIPPEFAGPADLVRCGVVAVWSKPFRPGARRAGERRGGSVAQSRIYDEDSVTVRPVLDTASLRVSFPDSLLASGVSGRVLIQFVIDPEGRVEPATVEIVAASDGAFVAPARSAVLGARFDPAVAEGEAVRARVRLPIVFDASIRSRAPDDSRQR